MSGSRLDRLCRHYGIATDYEDPKEGPDAPRLPVPDATKRLILERLGVDPEGPPQGPPAPRGIHAPHGVQCHCPGWLDDAPAWGVFCQLYELRSGRNWGIGDFRDLADLARGLAATGADFLGVNPLHALFPGDPGRCSPFSPSNRSFLNPIYIAVDDLPGAPRGDDLPGASAGEGLHGAPVGGDLPGVPPGDAAALAPLRAADAVDYVAVTGLKLRALRRAFDARPFGLPPYDRAAHDAYAAEGGEALARHALFEALSLHQAGQGRGAGWHGWEAELQDPGSKAVAAFARDHAQDLAFHLWLQWVASVQLDAARDAARAAGMRIGLYLDLAVGEAPDGSATWAGRDLTLQGLTVGAPPDVFATEGQSWGLSAPSPRALAARDFAPFAQMIAAQLAHAGALRIDHAMALWQLFLIPEGQEPAAGAHLRYPFGDLVRVLAELSQRHAALVIGEDLGFVPPGFREAMDEARILAYRILYFEQGPGGFAAPGDYPPRALACLSTHDLPTLAGWWRAEDIALREEHGLVDPQSSAEQAGRRRDERAELLAAFVAEGVLPQAHADAALRDPEARDLPEEVLVAAHRFVARTPCLLAGVRLADLVGPEAPTNLPGTVDAYPNWRLRAPVPIDRLSEVPAFRAVTAAMAKERPRR